MKKRILAIILSVVTLLGVMAPLTASATDSGDRVRLYPAGAYNADGHRYNHGTPSSGTGIAMIDINGKVHNRAWGYIDAIHIGSYTGPLAYCIQMGTALGDDNYIAEDITFNDLWRSNLSAKARFYISLITMYGYPNYSYGAHWVDAYVATQCLIWEFSLNFRTSTDGFNNPSGYAGNQLYNMTIKGQPAEAVYNRILSEMKAHETIPSFASSDSSSAPVHEMTWNSSANRCEYRIPTAQVSSYKFTTLPAGVNVTTSGSDTVFYTTVDVDANSGTVTMKKNLPDPPQNLLVFNNPGAQACITGTAQDPVAGYFKLKSEIRGNVKIVKTSEDGVVGNIPFTISGNGVNQNVQTTAYGEILIENLRPGVYTVTEGTIDRYVTPTSQTVTVMSNQTATVKFNNVLKKFRVTVTKKDSEFSYPQGGAKISGAVYGLYNGSALTASYTTGPDGTFTTDYFTCGDNWTIREITESEGYLCDPTVHKVGAEARLYTVQYNNAPGLTSLETVKKGRVQIIKHTDDGGETKVETPETGAAFELFLENAGSYNAARPTERDILICDENGMATSKLLPYGIYRVHQISGWPGKEKVKDFLVYVSEGGKTYPFIINNSTMTSKIKVEKRNAEDGELIAAAGIGFMMKKPDGSILTQEISYPTPRTLTEFFTNEEGWLMLPQELEWGYGYQLIEIQAAPLFFLSDEPVTFDVTGETTFITVTKFNSPQKARIHVDKRGEVFAAVTLTDEIYRPQYEVQGLAGGIYDIYADEDIYLNNKLMIAKDTRVATLTTTKNGATSPLLYLGRYRILERQAPFGMVGTDEVKTLTLSYRGQTVKEYTDGVSFFNERQRVKISFEKIMKQDELYKIGMNGEIAAVRMGLYADADIVAADVNGSGGADKIPKDGLIETVEVDIKSGFGTFTVDLPVSAKVFLQEIATDEQYLLSNQKYPLEFTYAGQDIPLVELTANNGEPILNEIKRGSVEGLKTDEDGKELEGALIGLFAPDTTEFTKENALFTDTSCENGAFSFEGVAYGEWVCREIAAPGPQYVLDDTVYPVTISADKQIIKIEIENRFVRGSVRTTKVDAEYPDNKLSGAVFDVFMDTDGNGEFDENTDLLAGTLEEIKCGIYQLDGLVYSGYFLHERSAPDLFLLDENYYFFEILMDGEIVDVENQAGTGFINQPKTGELWLTKTDVSTGKLIPNCGIRIKDEAGNIVVEGRTDENGVAKFRLRVGKYTYSEFDCPGYILDESEYPFEIKENGEIIKAEMTNEKIPENPDIPKTGDNSNMGLWLGLAAVALGGLIAMLIIKKKK